MKLTPQRRKLVEAKLRQMMREVEDEEEPDPQQQQKSAPVEQPPTQPDKNPAKKKESGLKYEMKYVNGGFNDGVKIEPTNGGKLALEISIYGGGEPKKVNIPASPSMQKIIKGYEVAFNSKDSMGTTMEPEMDRYMSNLKHEISLKVIRLMQEMDMKVKQIIIQTIKEQQ